jgi:DNA-binding CsgD family transcriptional regulator
MKVRTSVRTIEEADMEIAAISRGSEEVIDSCLDKPGVLVFTSSFQLCYRDQRATELCEQITRHESTKTANGILPLAVTSLADEIHRLLRIRTESKDWEQFQIRRVAGNPNHPVLLCGFGVVEADVAPSRIVIIMQVTRSAFWHRRVLDRSKEKFQLTWRETNILQHLMKGWTNKEIANTLSISEQTVKEHMKHLLVKMCVTTRTGIVMKAVLCGLHYEAETFQSNPIEPAFPLSMHAEA